MTDELETRFFEGFGIEPEEEKYCMWECKIPELEHVACNKQCEHQRHNISYPEITDRILLELICIANRVATTMSETIDELKEETLQTLIETQEILTDEECLFPMAHWARKKKEKEKEETYTQVRAVFGLESEGT